MKKSFFGLGLMALLVLGAVGVLFHILEIYNETVHGDGAFVVQAYTLIAAVLCGSVWYFNRLHSRAYHWALALCLAALAGVFIVGGKIPFCVKCEQVTAEELGFLAHWITPSGG